MTYKQLKEAFRELEFLNQGKMMDDYDVVVVKQYKSDRNIEGVKIKPTRGATIHHKIVIETH